MISKEVYTFNADGEMICKRAFKNLDGSITLVSDNTDKPRYPDQLLIKTNLITLISLVGCVIRLINYKITITYN